MGIEASAFTRFFYNYALLSRWADDKPTHVSQFLDWSTCWLKMFENHLYHYLPNPNFLSHFE